MGSCDVEAILNSRPLIPLSSDTSDLLALTPGHFLIGNALTSLRDRDLQETTANRLSAWQRVQQLKQHFWKRWHHKYLNELANRNKWTRGQHPIIKGGIVLLREDNIPSYNGTEAFDRVIDSIDKDGKLLFLDGPAGSGKTYLYKVIIDYIKSIGKVVLPFATTGIRADLLDRAKTVHSGFKSSVPLFENSASRIKEGSKEAMLLSKASLILIDEASILSKYALNAIDEVLRRITNNDNIFGGQTVLLSGDFRQTANVVMRGENSINDANNMVEIPEMFIEKGNIVNSIFGEGSIDTTDELLYDKIMLTSRNNDAVKLNTLIIDKIDEVAKTYVSIDTIASEDNNDYTNYPIEFINKQQPSGMPAHILKLKVGTVMLLRNLDQNNGLLNGTRMVVKELHDYYIVCKTLIGVNKGRIVAIPRIETILPFVLKRDRSL
nr:ATP-dependent DNA helicase pif1-like [Megalopta genalis]